MSDDYLSSLPSWCPGEFARRQAEFDATLTTLATAVAPLLLEPVQRNAAEASALLTFTERELQGLAFDEAFLMANYIWGGWLDAFDEMAQAPRDERQAPAAAYAIQWADWGDELETLREPVTRALLALPQDVLPEALPA